MPGPVLRDTAAVTVAVVGAGIAGAACARALRGAGVDVEVLDRGRVPGGRMASRALGGRRVDLGASYLTARSEDFVAVVDDWVARGLAHPWTSTFHVASGTAVGEPKEGPLRYGTPGGLRSLVVDLLDGTPVQQGVDVAAVGSGPTVDGRAYDAVVLAMPDPQAERLLDASLAGELAAVRGRAWEPVLALAAGFATRTWDLDGCFVEDDDVLGWVADDGRRRGDGAPVLVAHSTSAFAAGRLVDPPGAAPAMVAAVSRLLGVTAAPEWTFVQRWSLARPAAPRDEPFHLGEAGVGLCGDGWGSPRVETAWTSGHLLGTELARRL